MQADMTITRAIRSTMQRWRRSAVLAVLVLSTACSSGGGGGDGGEEAADPRALPITDFAAGWSIDDASDAAAATDSPRVAERYLADTVSRLALAGLALQPQGEPECADEGCTQAVAVQAEVSGIGAWSYQTRAQTVETPDGWRVAWSPALVHPALDAGSRLSRVRDVPRRAPILDVRGRPLVQESPVFAIGVVPGESAPDTYARVGRLTGVDASGLRASARQAGADEFVPAITLRRSDYTPLRDELLAIPGVLVDSGTLPLAPTAGWGRGVLGTVGPATAEALEAAGPLATATDNVGLSGLQAAYEQQLAGAPGGHIELVDQQSDATERVLWRAPAQPGEPVQTTLDRRIQDAAERAVAGAPSTASLVVLDARFGGVLAAANGPKVSSYNLAFVGRYAPGSTMKVLTSAALLQAGLSIDDPADCDPTVTVDGKRFKNYEFETLPAQSTYAEGIAASCNSTVISQRSLLDEEDLHEVATKQFGIEADYGLPIESFSGSVPVSTGETDEAAAMIGQGRVEMSALSMASVAATARTGTAYAPSLLADKPGEELGTLPAGVSADLQEMMRLVVSQGTASSLRGLGPVGAKTGTAEYGDGSRTHGWMIGYRGDLAFACVVVDGESGNGAAGPVVRAFLQRAPR
jgi:cell division protein FtsI/penicillin-binding protein 2